VSKAPPTRHGVARYTVLFRQALAATAAVRPVDVPSRTDTVAGVLKTVMSVRRAIRRERPALAWFELSGRALGEFYTAAWVAPRVPTVVTLHDAPSIAGDTGMFRLLDRRGLRRLSRSVRHLVGRPAERRLEHQATAWVTLSQSGADAVRSQHPLAVVVTLPLVAAGGRVPKRTPLVFVPGFYRGRASVTPALDALRMLPPDVIVAIGGGGSHLGCIVREWQESNSDVQGRVAMLGDLDESALDDMYRRATVVVRLLGQSPAGGGRAVSGPVIDALAHGCALVTDDQRGAADVLENGVNALVVEPGDLDAARDAVIAVCTDGELRSRLAEAARRTIERGHSIDVVSRRIVSLLQLVDGTGAWGGRA
jgi:glycosyltransferase involved in cell wall biosynthesis